MYIVHRRLSILAVLREEVDAVRATVRRDSLLTSDTPIRNGGAERIATLAKALGHPARVHIVRMLVEKQSCIGCDIVDEIGLAQSTTSEHLRILKSAGIITGEIERPRVCYSLNGEPLRLLRDFLTVAAQPPKPSRNAVTHAR